MRKRWENFTVGRIEAFRCEPGRQQAIFMDGRTPGLGVRVTAAGSKSFIFETMLNGKTIRITIGDVRTWTIPEAQAKATAFKAQTDSGIDPREVKAAAIAKEAAVEAGKAVAAEQGRREALQLIDVWPLYIKDRVETRQKGWSKHHLRAHNQVVQEAGLPRKKGAGLTSAGPLATLRHVRLIDLDRTCIEDWAKVEGKARPSSARLAMRLLKAFLHWCTHQPEYSGLVDVSSIASKRARESLGKGMARSDKLQREQLAAWFKAVRMIGNPIISAYLQMLLLTGARREELAALKWDDVDFQWMTVRLSDKVKPYRIIPLTPYVTTLLQSLPRRSEWVFSSATSKSGHVAEPRIAHNDAVKSAGLPPLTLHGLRRSFASLSEWVEVPAGIAAQIQGHSPKGVRETHYLNERPIDLLRAWHVKIEDWILAQIASPGTGEA